MRKHRRRRSGWRAGRAQAQSFSASGSGCCAGSCRRSREPVPFWKDVFIPHFDLELLKANRIPCLTD